MKFSVLLSSAVFLTSVLAAPRGLAARVNRRAADATRTTPHEGAPLHLLRSEDIIDGDNNVTHVEYSSNWAGAVLTAPPSGTTFNAVSGQFTVPTPKLPSSSASGTYAASVWVGIDGDTYQNSILQAGIDVTITKSGSKSTISYDSWYEWYPNYATDFSTSSFSFTAGNVISVSVTSSSSTKGVVTLTNESTGKSVSKSLSAPSSSAKLGGQNAEWIVEDFEEGGSLVNFANFGTVLFTDAVAGASDGSTVGTSDATIIEIENQSGTVLTDVSIPSDSEVQIVYV